MDVASVAGLRSESDLGGSDQTGNVEHHEIDTRLMVRCSETWKPPGLRTAPRRHWM